MPNDVAPNAAAMARTMINPAMLASYTRIKVQSSQLVVDEEKFGDDDEWVRGRWASLRDTEALMPGCASWPSITLDCGSPHCGVRPLRISSITQTLRSTNKVI